MRVAFLTCGVLGTEGANAAFLYPYHASNHEDIDKTFAFDTRSNKENVIATGCEFKNINYKREGWVDAIKTSKRISHEIRKNKISLLHCFYRGSHTKMILALKIMKIIKRQKFIILMDHRSVNISAKPFARKIKNIPLLISCDAFAGNINAIKTNYIFKPRKSFIFDLGWNNLAFDGISPDKRLNAYEKELKIIWFIGSISPANRKSNFLFDLARVFYEKSIFSNEVVFLFAGPANEKQVLEMEKHPSIYYLGKLDQIALYSLLRNSNNKSIGLAYMNTERHNFAPALKLVEYALFDMPIIATRSKGLMDQVDRFKIPNVVFAKNTVADFVSAIESTLQSNQSHKKWHEKEKFNYEYLFNNQVLKLYKCLT